MRRYQSHKVVEAFQIIEIVQDITQQTVLKGVEDTVYVDDEYMDKHQPKVGGYFVLYADGYESWSPAEAFESGYTEVEAA